MNLKEFKLVLFIHGWEYVEIQFKAGIVSVWKKHNGTITRTSNTNVCSLYIGSPTNHTSTYRPYQECIDKLKELGKL